MTVEDTKRRHPAGKALPEYRAHLARSVARESIAKAIAGTVLVQVVALFAIVSYLSTDLPTWLRLLMLLPVATIPAAVLQAVHGATDAKRLLEWARHFDREADETNTNRRSNK